MKGINLDEAMFEGAISFERTAEAIRPWRLPFDQLALFPDSGLVDRAGTCAGVRLRFETDSRTIGLEVVPADVERRFDLTLGEKLVASVALEPGADKIEFDRESDDLGTVEVWFPQAHAVFLKSLTLKKDAALEVPYDPRPKWIHYGSSISHCGAAHSPARTWPAIAARARGLSLTCLGYSGNCHMEPMIARMIRDQQADFISLKVGINIYGAASLSARTFKSAVIGMVEIIREKHPDIPIALISPIVSPPRESQPNAVGLTLEKMRDEIEDACVRIQSCGDRNVHYFSGLDIFGQDLAAKYLPDNLHPNADGYEVLGQNFALRVLTRIPLGQ